MTEGAHDPAPASVGDQAFGTGIESSVDHSSPRIAQRRASGKGGDGPRAAALAAVVWAATLGACGPGPAEHPELVIFAAASLRDALDEVGDRFAESHGGTPVFNFAGSNVLARQLASASVADVFVSADEHWMDQLERAHLLEPGSRRNFLSNRLVVVAHRAAPVELARLADLAAIDFRWLSLADPDAVPAGRYARSLLESVPLPRGSLWDAVGGRVVPAPDVRAALHLVEAEPRAVGIVYRSDVSGSAYVRILLEAPAERSPEIRYVAAILRDAGNAALAAAFLDFLAGPEAATVFLRLGFDPLPPETGERKWTRAPSTPSG